PGWSRGQRRSAPLPPKSSTATASAKQNRAAAACQPDCSCPHRCASLPTPALLSLPLPADRDSTGKATPDAASNKVLREACCNPADISFPGTSKNAHSRNKTRKSPDVPRCPDSSSLPEYATEPR